MTELTREAVELEITNFKTAAFCTIEDAIEFLDNEKYICYNIERELGGKGFYEYRATYRVSINHPRFQRLENKESYIDYSKQDGAQCPWIFA